MNRSPRDEPPRLQNQRKVKREHLLEAAVEAFCDLGFAGATIVEISRRAGVGDGTLYLYFKSKNALWREALILKLSALSQKADRELKSIFDPRKKVAAFFQFHLRDAAHDPKQLLFVVGCVPPTLSLQEFHHKQLSEYWQKFMPQLEDAMMHHTPPCALLPSQSARIAISALSKVCESLAKQELILGTEAVKELNQRLTSLVLVSPVATT